jgi:hypothetical protein
MLVTAYLVVSTTTVLTPQDVHIIDMQLQQLGNDALAMMDTPDEFGITNARQYSELTEVIINNEPDVFKERFQNYINNTTNVAGTGYDRLRYNATISYWNVTNQMNTTPFGGDIYYRENAVKVSRWVYLPPFDVTGYPYQDMNSTMNQSVLMEVLLWRE